MKARKVGLLVLILCFGLAVEAAWSVRHLGFGPTACRVFRGRFYGPSFAFEAQPVKVALPEGTSVEVVNTFGAVEVRQGADGEVRVGFRKVVFVPSERQAQEVSDRLKVETALADGVLRISTNREELEREKKDADVGLETHLNVAVPAGTTLTVRNAHGRVVASDVGALQVANSFGDVEVEGVTGPAKVENRHGPVNVSRVAGSLELFARHGEVRAEDVDEVATLDVQHGNATVTRVGGLVVKLQHGRLQASEVRGDLEARGSHARVEATDVKGNATVETSFQEIRLEGVGGDVRAKARHGEIHGTHVGGDVVVETSFDDVVLEDIERSVEARVSHGGVHARRIKGGARVKASGDDVVIDGFRGPVEIEVMRGAAHLVADGALDGPVLVTSKHGEIHLTVSERSPFDLEAEARRGEVRVEAASFHAARSEPGRVNGRVGDGGPLVKLSADHGNVRVDSTTHIAEER